MESYRGAECMGKKSGVSLLPLMRAWHMKLKIRDRQNNASAVRYARVWSWLLKANWRSDYFSLKEKAINDSQIHHVQVDMGEEFRFGFRETDSFPRS